MNPKLTDIFRSSSKTFYYANRFFPKEVREDITRLYAFVRKGDNFIDNQPQDRQGWYKFKKDYVEALNGKRVDDVVVQEFAKLARAKKFDPNWIKAFFTSMEQDLDKAVYRTIEDVEKYIYGSAEVIGLLVAKVLNLPTESYYSAQMLGKSLQYINFIRDVKEDFELGRSYFPEIEMKESGFERITPGILTTPELHLPFKNFMKKQAERYVTWQKEAEKGYKYLPKRVFVAIKTASDMYEWTLSRILKDPLIVFRKKVKPGKLRVIFTGLKNYFLSGFSPKT